MEWFSGRGKSLRVNNGKFQILRMNKGLKTRENDDTLE